MLQDDLQTYFGEHKVRLKSLVPCKEMWWYTFHDQYHATHPGCAEYLKGKDILGIQCKVRFSLMIISSPVYNSHNF